MQAHGGRLLLRSRAGHHWSTGRAGLVLTIADTGSGMSSETVKRIFEPFFTTKGIGGTGLGLWVSQGIVERHQGALRLRSTQGSKWHGTVLALFLPFDAVVPME
jgi:signal transduction histidine kinase